jgi:hypothetical protein
MIRFFRNIRQKLAAENKVMAYLRYAFGKISLVFFFVLLFNFSIIHAQFSNETKLAAIDVEKERPQIESRDSLYAKFLLEGDSVSIAAMYAKEGKIGCIKGSKILSAAGAWIRSLAQNKSRVSFKTVTLNADGELLIETGIAETRNDKGELRNSSKYLVVWKKEDGTWKLYRDVGL